MRSTLFSSLAIISLLVVPVSSGAVDPVCGDVNLNGTLTTADALAVLKASVGQNINLQCPAPASPLEAGQETCFNEDGSEVTCAGTGQDGELRKGVAPKYTDNGDGTVTDASTGLTWEKLDRNGGIHDEGEVYSWLSALEKADTLNEQSFAGHTDWRLPNVTEARTLLDLGTFSPAVAPAFDNNCADGCTITTCNCIQPDWYWTSNSYEETPEDAWFVDMYNGYTDTTTKTEVNFARVVRGGL